MSFIVGWDKRQLSRAGPPLGGLPLVGRRSHSLAGPTLLSADPQVFSVHCFKTARSSPPGEVEKYGCQCSSDPESTGDFWQMIGYADRPADG